MNMRRKLVLTALLIAVGYFLNEGVRFFREFETRDVKLCTLEAGVHDVYIDIYTPSFNEVSQSLMYQVRTGKTVESPIWQMTVVEMGRKIDCEDFALLTAKNGKLVAVVFSAEPKSILAMYDFSTGETWPRPAYSEDFTSTRGRGEKLLEHLKQATGDEELSLAGG